MTVKMQVRKPKKDLRPFMLWVLDGMDAKKPPEQIAQELGGETYMEDDLLVFDFRKAANGD